VTLEQLHDLQCYLEGIGPEVLFSRSRKWDVIKHRKAFCVVARGYKITYREIGQYLAGFDHSTIVHNVQGFEYELGEKRDELQLLVDRLSGKISVTSR
jgi:chromosomal replication initiation ATPase DnaA